MGRPDGELSSAPSDHWPTIGEMAEIWRRFGVLPLGACHSKAFTMATLLYRAGIGRDSVAALAGRGFGLTQHFYVGVRVDGRWCTVDPSCIRQQMKLSPDPASFGAFDTDYRHPFSIQPLPGAWLTSRCCWNDGEFGEDYLVSREDRMFRLIHAHVCRN